MSWSNLADLALKSTIRVFKTAATYTRAADPENPFDIDGVFDQINQAVDPETGAVVDSKMVTFGIRVGDLGTGIEPGPGDQIAIGAKTYEVMDSQEDGEGGSRLTLSRLT